MIELYYKGFTLEEVEEFEGYLRKVFKNLQQSEYSY
jgi:hypothetical protein